MSSHKAALYLRVGLEGSRGLDSLKAQERRARDYSGQNGWEVAEIFIDVGASDSQQRPELMRLMANAQVGAFDVVVMDAPSRLFREQKQVQAFLETLKRSYGVEVVFVEWVGEGGAA